MGRAYLHTSRALGLLIAVAGVAMIVSTLIRGGGPLSVGVVLGAVFMALGAGRLYVSGVLRDSR